MDTNHFNTLFTGKFLLHLEETPSTNSYLKEWLTKNKPRDGAVILTDKQTAGRGQGSHVWESTPGLNITTSILYICTFLPAQQQFPLSAAVALAVRRTVADFLPDQRISIKWPNDIFIDNRKVAGILIENTLQGQYLHYSIIGIGINVLQEDFPLLPQACSMKQYGYVGTKEKVFGRLMERLEQAYFRLKKGQLEGIRADYESYLWGKGQLRSFEASGKTFEGSISGITDDGRLLIDTAEGPLFFRHQEVSWVL